MNPSLLGFGCSVNGMVVLSVVVGVVVVVVRVVVVVVLRVVLVVGLLAVLTVVGRVAPCEKERLYVTTSRNTSHRDQGQCAKLS